MLEDVAVDDRVERTGQGLRRLLEVGDHHLRAPAARPLGLGGIALERGHAPSLPSQELRQKAVGGARIEESAAASRPEPVEDDRVARVGVALEPIGRGVHGGQRVGLRISSATLRPLLHEGARGSSQVGVG